MATKKSTTASRPARNRVSAETSAARSKSRPTKVPDLTALEDIVEEERLRLMKAHSILSCAITGIEDEDICRKDGPYWPAVIESACDLVNESIRRLEDLDYAPRPTIRKGYEVRESAGFSVGSTFLSTRDGIEPSEQRTWGDRQLATDRAAEIADIADIAAALEPGSRKRTSTPRTSTPASPGRTDRTNPSTGSSGTSA